MNCELREGPSLGVWTRRDPWNISHTRGMVGPPRHREQQIAQTIHVAKWTGAHRLKLAKRHHESLRAATNGARKMESRCQLTARWHDKGFQWRIRAVNLVDPTLDFRDVVLLNPHDLRTVVRALGRCEIGADIKEPRLNVREDLEQSTLKRVLRTACAHHDANNRVELVHRAVRLNARVIFGDAGPRKESCGSIVAGSGVELHRLIPRRSTFAAICRADASPADLYSDLPMPRRPNNFRIALTSLGAALVGVAPLLGGCLVTSGRTVRETGPQISEASVKAIDFNKTSIDWLIAAFGEPQNRACTLDGAEILRYDSFVRTTEGSYFFMLAASSTNTIERTCWWFETRDGKVVRAWGEQCDPVSIDSMNPPRPAEPASAAAEPGPLKPSVG